MTAQEMGLVMLGQNVELMLEAKRSGELLPVKLIEDSVNILIELYEDWGE